MSYTSAPEHLSKAEKYARHLERLKETSDPLVSSQLETKLMAAEVPVQRTQAPQPEQITVENCDGDIKDTVQALGNFGAAYDQQAEDELRSLIEARGRKKKFGGSGYRW